MTIRMARADDIPRMGELLLQVCAVHRDGRPDLFRAGGRKYTDEQLAALIGDPTRPILVAADEQDRVVGYAFCVLQQADTQAQTGVRTLYIDDLCVDERCRGQRVGTALYDAAVSLARERGCYNLTLNVWCCNPDALAFYESRGLKPQKIGMETIL